MRKGRFGFATAPLFELKVLENKLRPLIETFVFKFLYVYVTAPHHLASQGASPWGEALIGGSLGGKP